MNQTDVVFYNGPVLTMTEPEPLIRSGFLAVNDGRIAGLGTYDPAAPPPWQAREEVDLRGNLLMPGLINAHTHAAMTIFRGLADDRPLKEWLENYIFPVEKELSFDWVYWGTKLACLEMISAGTTTFCDMYLFEQAVAQAADEAGLRALVGEVLYDFPSPNYGPPDKGLAYTRELIERWRGHDRVSIAVEPHAPYTCSPELLKQCHLLAREYDVPLIIHLAETAGEVEEIRARYGTTPVAHLDGLGLLGPDLLAVHLVHVEPSELDRIAAAEVKVLHNPESNMKLASGTAPIPAMLRRGVTVGLGTDGCASNNNLDLFQEMDSAAKLIKLTHDDPTAVPARTVVEMATVRGARALRLDSVTGSLEPGKDADLIVIDFHQPHLTPVYDYFSHLVYCARGADVLSTMVRGRWLMRDRTVLTLDQEEVYAHLAPIAAGVAAKVRKLD